MATKKKVTEEVKEAAKKVSDKAAAEKIEVKKTVRAAARNTKAKAAENKEKAAAKKADKQEVKAAVSAEAKDVKDAAKIEEYNASVATTYDVVSRWAYNEYNDPDVNYNDAFYDLDTRGAQFMNEIILAQVAPQSRISVVVSHDQMLYPLVIYATNRMLEMKHHESKSWLNYLAGVAVIIHADGSVKYVPIMGLDEGTMQS